MPLTYESIATQTLSSVAASITFSSIPATFTDLRLVLVARLNNTSVPRENMLLRFNGDTASNYSTTMLAIQDTSVLTLRQTNQDKILIYTGIPGTTGQFSLTTIDVLSYAGATLKSCLVSTNNDQNTVGGEVNSQVGLYRSASAITSVTLVTGTNSFDVGTTASLYGIKNA